MSSPSGTSKLQVGLVGLNSLAGPSGTTSFVYLPDGTPLEEVTPSGAYYYATDNQGSVIGLIDTGGTPHAAYIYTPYGVQTATAENGALPSNPYGWDGGYTDTSTGVALVHFGNRYYDPATGRWTQLDSTGKDSGYVYANDDPVNSADTDGQKTRSFYLNTRGSRTTGAATS